MVCVVSILRDPLELWQLFEPTLVNAPHFPVVGPRSAYEVPIVGIEGDFSKLSLSEVLTSNDLLLGARPVIYTDLGIKILIAHQNNNQFSIFTKIQRYDFSLWRLWDIVICL